MAAIPGGTQQIHNYNYNVLNEDDDVNSKYKIISLHRFRKNDIANSEKNNKKELYLLETKLPENKSVFFALTNVYGIGQKTAFLICKKLGFSMNLKIKDLTQEQIVDILQIVESLNLTLNNELKKLRSLTLKKLISLKSYRGLRRVRGLPVRGQRTHTNAKSARKNRRF